MMTIDDNKALSRRALNLWASRNQEIFEDVFAETYINHQEPAVEGSVSDEPLAIYKQLLRDFHLAFGTSTVRILMQIGEGDLVATRWEFTAAQTGPYLGHPASGREATWTGIQIDRHKDGKIAESWVDWDKYRLLETLGLIG